MQVDNPMTRNTDYYPFNSKREYRESLEERIIEIQNKIDELKMEKVELEGELENLK